MLHRFYSKALAALAAILLLAAPALAQDDPAIVPGFDNWQTVGGGASYMNFADNPIPASFFCEGSEAFTGKILLEGMPLATEPAGALGTTDTIVERLDPAFFEDGVARSRLRIKAIHLVSREPLQMACGEWDVTMGLTDKQPITEILYEMAGDDYGFFSADLVLNAKITFTHRVVKKLTRTLERTVHFSEFHRSPFTMRPAANDDAEAAKRNALLGVRVDTDADGLVDNTLALTVLNGGTRVVGTTIAVAINKKCVFNATANGVYRNCVWQYPYNTWLCPPGITPPHPSCVLYGSMHQAPPPGHRHTVIPPCTSGSSTNGYCAHGKPNPGWTNPDIIVIGDAQLNPLDVQLQQMWEDGILVVPPAALLEEMSHKVNMIEK